MRSETKSYIDVRSSNTWEMMVFILSIFDQLNLIKLVEDCGWVLEEGVISL